jgi:hypothetical protein
MGQLPTWAFIISWRTALLSCLMKGNDLGSLPLPAVYLFKLLEMTLTDPLHLNPLPHLLHILDICSVYFNLSFVWLSSLTGHCFKIRWILCLFMEDPGYHGIKAYHPLSFSLFWGGISSYGTNICLIVFHCSSLLL